MMIGTFMAALDSSIVNISLPPMAAQFNAQLTEIEWVILSYMIGFAVSIPLTNWLRDNVGFRSLYMGSLGIFIFGSALCGFAPTLDFLIFARVIQALGGGALTPAAMAILSTAFPPRERGRAIGIWGLGVVMGPAIGPTLGGVLTGHYGWPSIFLVNIPIGIAGMYLASKTLKGPVMTSRRRTRFDWMGFLSLSVFLVSVMMAVNALTEGTAGSALSLWLLAAGSVALFIFFTLRSKDPLLDLRILKNRQFLACILVTIGRSGALYGAMFLLPFLMQDLLKFSEVKSGMLMLPGSLLVAILMPMSGRWADQNGSRNIVLLGIMLLAVSMVVFGFVRFDMAVLMILVAMALRGLGLGLLAAPVSTATVNSVRASEVTLASSISSLFQQCGGALGVSLFALVHKNAFERAVVAHSSNALAEALQFSFISTGIAFLFVLLPALYLPRDASGTSAKNQDMLLE